MTKTGLNNVPQAQSYTWKKQGGYGRKYTEEFTSEALAKAAGELARSQGCSDYSVTNIGAECYRMEASFQDAFNENGSNNPNEPLNDAWELVGNMGEKDFLSADIAITNGLDSEEIRLIRNAAEDNSADITEFTGSMMTALGLLLAKVSNVVQFDASIRHTLTVRNDYAIQSALTNVGSVLTTAKLRALESVPGTILFNIPTKTPPSRSDDVEVIYGWLKKYPTVTQQAGGRWNISQEWQFGLWARELYTIVE